MNNTFIIQGQAEIAAGIRYEVDFAMPPIGEGGMGRVYSGLKINERTGVRQPVAVKFLYEDLPLSMIERVKREASIQIHNDNLVEMFGLVTVDVTDANGHMSKRLHVVSELLRGVMLHDLLQGSTTDVYGEEVPFAQELYALLQRDRTSFALSIVKPILSGIMALHDNGYIHRDIDPSNIMITVDRKVKLIDFGIARKLGTLADDRQLTHVGTFIGKAEYAAPELVLGDINHQNETTDIYALGIVLFQLATGHKPFTGPTNEVLYKQQYEPLPLAEISDPVLRGIVKRATEKIQSARYQSAAEFRVDIDRMGRTETPPAHVAAPINPYSSESMRAQNPAMRSHSGVPQSHEVAGTQIVDSAPAMQPAARSAETQAMPPAAETKAMPPAGTTIVPAADTQTMTPAGTQPLAGDHKSKQNRKQKNKSSKGKPDVGAQTLVADAPSATDAAGTMIVEAPASGGFSRQGADDTLPAGGTIISESPAAEPKGAAATVAARVSEAPRPAWQAYIPWIAASVGGLIVGCVAGLVF